MKRYFMFAFVALAAFGALSLAACNEESSTAKGQRLQEMNMQRAVDAIAVPPVKQFTTRKSIARWVSTANEPDQTHYVYVMLPGVGHLGYYVADAAPVNICTSLTPPVREYSVRGKGANQLGPAPALDGVYYSGSQCDMWYFFDVVTGTKIEIGGNMAFFTSMVPLSLDVPKLTVNVKK